MATRTRKPHTFRPDADRLEARDVPAVFTGFGQLGVLNPFVAPTAVGGFNTGSNLSFNTAGNGLLGVRNPFIRVPSNVNPNLLLSGGRLVTSSPLGVNGTFGTGLPSGFGSQSGLAFNSGLGGFGSGSFNTTSGLGFNSGLGGTGIGSLLNNNFASINNLFNRFVPSFTGVSTAFGVNNQNGLATGGLNTGLFNGLNTGLFNGVNTGLLNGVNGLNGLSNTGLGVNTGLTNLGLGLNNNFGGLVNSGFGLNTGTGALATGLLGSNQFGQFGIGNPSLFGR